MPKFRKKPVVIEAVQFLPGVTDTMLVAHLEGCTGWRMVGGDVALPMPGDAFAYARPGYWIARQVLPDGRRDFWPIAEATFAATYEPVEG
jgi:hypothetical protein